MKHFKLLLFSGLFFGMSMISDTNPHIISRDQALKMSNLFHKRNNIGMPALVDPQYFKIQKRSLLSLVSKIKVLKDNNQIGYLVGRFGCDDKDNNFENLSLTLGGYVQDDKGALSYISSKNISDESLLKKSDSEKRFQNYIERVNILNGDIIANEKGGFSQIVFTKNQENEDNNLEKWLNITSFENDIVYLYPAVDITQKHSTIIFTNDKNLQNQFEFVNSNNIQKSYFDRGSSCCPPPPQ